MESVISGVGNCGQLRYLFTAVGNKITNGACSERRTNTCIRSCAGTGEIGETIRVIRMEMDSYRL